MVVSYISALAPILGCHGRVPVIGAFFVSEEAVCCFSQIWHLILISRVYFSLIGMLDDYSGLFCLFAKPDSYRTRDKNKIESGGNPRVHGGPRRPPPRRVQNFTN